MASETGMATLKFAME